MLQGGVEERMLIMQSPPSILFTSAPWGKGSRIQRYQTPRTSFMENGIIVT
jgi:hypothetical protein